MRVTKGDRVVHKELDDSETGTAKTGIVTDVIDEGQQSLVIAEFEDGDGSVAFDDREIARVGKPIGSNRSPILLKPRHLYAIIKTRFGALLLIMAVVFGAAIGIVATNAEWSVEAILVALAAILVLILFLNYALNRSRLSDGSHVPPPESNEV